MKCTTAALLRSVAGALSLTIAAAAQAAPINYGSVNDFGGGGVVEYTNVTESTASDTPPLYNAPDVVVNLLDFDPTAFGASSAGGVPDITDGQLNSGFTTLLGTGLTSLVINESGDFTLTGVGTAATNVSYGLFAKVTVLQVDGLAVTPFNVVASAAFNKNLVANPGLNQPWSAALLIDLGPALVTNGHAGFSLGVTKGEIVINNTLVALSEAQSIAFLAKKDLNITPGGPLDPDNVIPEPAAALLAVVGAVGFLRRRS
ncbi:MAG: hypothetical protein ACRCT8_09065 [Lacipirellulaceae bacterium]